MIRIQFRTTVCLACSLVLFVDFANAQADKKDGSDSKNDEKGQKFDVANGQLVFVAPANWKKVTPKFDFYHAEFNIPKVEGDEKNGRITFSQVGGSIKANLDRWITQFKNVDQEDENQLKKSSETISGKTVELIKIKGTFLDGAGPLAPKTEREDYVLLGAAIEMNQGASIYIKSYGPKKTMAANVKKIKQMIKDMKVGEIVD